MKFTKNRFLFGGAILSLALGLVSMLLGSTGRTASEIYFFNVCTLGAFFTAAFYAYLISVRANGLSTSTRWAIGLAGLSLFLISLFRFLPFLDSSVEPMSSPDPSKLELSLITKAGRLQRLMKQGLSLEEATVRMLTPETADEYAERNRAAMQALEDRLLSPDYMQRFAAIQAVADPTLRAELEAALKRENFAEIDMEAVHRNISARNRQMKQEGLLPPDAPV